jgi:polysaccharide biosynthesis protein PslH
LKRLILFIRIALLYLSIIVLKIYFNFLTVIKKKKNVTFDKITKNPKLSVIIPTYNGLKMLSESLPVLFEQVGKVKYEIEILVVDNNSNDSSKEYINSNFPTVEFVELEKNYGFAVGCNIGAQKANGDILIFLNNDMNVCEDFFTPLVSPFIETDDLFATTSQIFIESANEKKRVETGLTRGMIEKGKLLLWHDSEFEEISNNKTFPTLYAGGGSSAIRKDMFMHLGGFDTLFEPFYFEDADLSARAWKLGLKVLFVPESKVIHKHRSTIARDFDDDFIKRIIDKNRMLFILRHFNIKNIFKNFFYESRVLAFQSNDNSVFESFTPPISKTFIEFYKRFLIESDSKNENDMESILLITEHQFFFREKYEPRRRFEIDNPIDILMITPYLPCKGNHAGAGRMFELIKRIAKRHNIDLISFYDSEFEERSIPLLEIICSNVITLKRVPEKDSSWFSFLPKPKDLSDFYSTEMRDKIIKQLDYKDYQIVQIEYQSMGCYLPVSKRLFQLITIHEVGFDAIKRSIKANIKASKESSGEIISYVKMLPMFMEYMKRFVYEISLYRKFDGVIALTSDEKNKLIPQIDEEKIFVVNTGVDIDDFRIDQKLIREIENDPVMIYVGYYGHYPNVDAVKYFSQDIFPSILNKFPEAKFIIAGNDPFGWISHLHNGENIICTGYVDDLKPYFNKSDIFVVPLRLGGGIRGKILESFAMKVPVIATSLSTQGLEVENGKHLLIADSKDEFASKTIDLIKDMKMRNGFSLVGRELVESIYDWGREAEKLDSVYIDLLKRG